MSLVCRWLLGLLLGGSLLLASEVQAQGQLINGNRTLVGTLNYCVDTGSGNSYQCNLAPPITAYVSGAFYSFKATHTNTAGAGLQFNGLAVAGISAVPGGVPTGLKAGAIQTGDIVLVYYDGTFFQMVSPSAVTPIWEPLVGTVLQKTLATNNTGDCLYVSLGFNSSTGATPNGGVLQVCNDASGNKVVSLLGSIGNAAAVPLLVLTPGGGVGNGALTMNGPMTYLSPDLPAVTGTLVDHAGVLGGTLTNSPATGNPTKFLRVCQSSPAKCYGIPAWELP